MDDRTGDEPQAELVPQPRQVARAVRVGGSSGLHLESNHVSTGQLGNQVDLAATLFVSQVIKARAEWAQLGLGPDLREDERVDQPTEQVAIA